MVMYRMLDSPEIEFSNHNSSEMREKAQETYIYSTTICCTTPAGSVLECPSSMRRNQTWFATMGTTENNTIDTTQERSATPRFPPPPRGFRTPLFPSFCPRPPPRPFPRYTDRYTSVTPQFNQIFTRHTTLLHVRHARIYVLYERKKVVVGSRILPARRVSSASASATASATASTMNCNKNANANHNTNTNANHYHQHHHGQHGGACGITHHVRDDARVFYFDDPVFEDVTAITGGRWGGLVAELRRLFCGSRGQAVRVQSRVCCGACVRTRGLAGLPCLPACCVCLCRSAALRYDIPVKVGRWVLGQWVGGTVGGSRLLERASLVVNFVSPKYTIQQVDSATLRLFRLIAVTV